MLKSESIAAIAAGLAKAQGQLESAKKDSTNPHFRSKYADLASCWDACRKALSANGIAVIQSNKLAEHGVHVITTLVHSSGEWISEEGLFVPATKQDAQGYGSALTYARRYGLCSMVGISADDDDGNSAASSAPQKAAITPTAGALDHMTPQERRAFEEMATDVTTRCKLDGPEKANVYLADQNLSTEDKVALWSLLDSGTRAALKKVMKKESGNVV